ncbi:hypothetical protein ACOQFV_07700 [Nocardiopsis changdeensis]|uniref:GntR family transcriptional regulator n=1 Tax=Nocardiopsis changdeensis TaxID=2831969 RepID=A0ABX8BE76_9ACTN|nr:MULTISPECIES: hypothetical protein [Nocardiopsis]QUX20552.1 hypothetical protein KGD84_18765 [Nocardiopsis changdeensis]QYX36483.1 hypothetical protein K1J57_28220 [Nocardiopsis sp. MT53]
MTSDLTGGSRLEHDIRALAADGHLAPGSRTTRPPTAHTRADRRGLAGWSARNT